LNVEFIITNIYGKMQYTNRENIIRKSYTKKYEIYEKWKIYKNTNYTRKYTIDKKIQNIHENTRKY